MMYRMASLPLSQPFLIHLLLDSQSTTDNEYDLMACSFLRPYNPFFLLNALHEPIAPAPLANMKLVTI